jgi:NACalpha-BTF3-like transcription factor
MDKEKFERARAIRAEIAWLKATRELDVDVDKIDIAKVVVVVNNGSDIVLGPEVVGTEARAAIKSMLDQYDEEIAKLEKEFEEL